jgi:hypothetical protein
VTQENRYHRIDATLPCYMELDDTEMIPLLVEIGQQASACDDVASEFLRVEGESA